MPNPTLASDRAALASPAVKRALLIGYGRIGKYHAANLRAMGVETVTVDTDAQAGAMYQSLDDALELGRYTHAVIATPAGAHLENLRAIAAGNWIPWILLEKPLCLTSQIAEACALSDDRVLAARVRLGFNWRFHPDYGKLVYYFSITKELSIHLQEDLPPHLDRLHDSLTHLLDLIVSMARSSTRCDRYDPEPPKTLLDEELSKLAPRHILVQNSSLCFGLDVAGRKIEIGYHHTEPGEPYSFLFRFAPNPPLLGAPQLVSLERLREQMHVAQMHAFINGRGWRRLGSFSDGLENIELLARLKAQIDARTGS